MAAKVFIQSVDRRSITKAKRSRAENLVRQLLAVQVSRYLYRLLRIKPAGEVIPQPALYEASESIHGGKTRWEPPKHKRDLKAHPWIDLQVNC